MAYARYFKRGKKRYGPFYYKSVRMPDGRVKSLYLGKTLPKGETIETERRFPSRNVIIIALLVFLVIGATSFTGYIIFRPTLVYHTETLNMTVNASQEYNWKPQNLGELNSIKLSGSMIGNGSVRVYIESQGKRYLILDRSLLKHKNSTLFGFVPFVRAEDKLNTTQDIELNFVDICVDTCFLTDLNESSYKLVFEVENGTILEIMEINYMIVEIEAMEEKTEKFKEFREKVIKLLPEKDNFKMNEKPRLRFTTNESVEPEGLGMFVYGPDKKLSDIKANVVKVGEGEFEIEISEKRSFRPGLYKMRMNFKEGDETHYQEAEFLWGVLAINTHKSIYLENEKAFIGIAVLDDQGHMVCDANVTLEITDPKNEKITLRTSDGTIEVSPECEVYGVTNLPDYYAYYTVNTEGNYTMKLTAVTRNGVRSMTDTFAVKKHVDFDVERNGPTRIYPPVNYSMVFTIKPYRDYEGPVREYVPISFEITPQNGLAVTTSGETKVLEWNSVLTTGQTHQIDYEFDAPDISPYLFVLGALEIGDWKEARQWMIASDAPVEVGYCRNLDSADTIYELNQSINSNSSNCLNVTAGNITIDGKGYTLTYAITDTGTGVNSNGYSQITIKNLIVTQTNTTRTSSPAIRIYDGQDNQIINNTIDVYGENSPDAYNYGIRFRNATNTTIANNTIITRTTCNYCHGIYLTTGSHNNTIEHNTITTIGDRSYGIYSVDSSQQTIYNNTIDMQDYYSRGISLYNSSYNTINQTTITADQQANVMRIEQYSSNNLITNSNMTNKYLGGWGIRIDTYSDDNNITNVNITAKHYAITLDSCQRTYIDNVYANGGELSAIYVITSNANDTRVNNSIMEMDRSTPSSLGAIHIRGDGWIVTNTNISTTGTYAAGIYLVGSNNFNGTNITIKTTGSGDSEAIRMSGSSTNNYFYDSTVSATNDDDVYFYSIGSGTLNLINTSIVDRYWYAPATHTLNVYWYLDAYVNYTNGSSMSGVTVAAWDKDSNQAFSESTGSSGKIPRQIVQEYTQNNTGSNYYSNYTVNASKTDYYTNTTSVNLTTNKLLYLTLTEIPLINITLNLDPNPANTNQNVSIYGHANQTDGNNVTNNTVNIYINDSMYYHNNNTGLLENTTVWWNTSWEYRKYIKVESLVSSTLTNTITMINFSTTSLISQGKMKSDCGDVRFTDSNGNELEYTLENSTCNSSNTVFWVWANLTGNANTTIFAYHGYSAASLKTDYTNLDSDLKLYMHFDKSSAYGESNTLVYDFSKNGNNGTCSGGTCPTWDSNGRFAGAFDFGGSDDYFAVADTDDLNTGGPWTNRTTILWFYANNVTKRQVLYEEGAGTRGFSIYIDDGKAFVGGWNNDSAQSNWTGTFLNATISTTTWYFLGFVLENGTDSAGPDRFRGYLDGSEFDSGDGRKMYAHAADIGIGAMNGDTAFHNGTSTGNGYYFNGSIDELRIYNRSLSLDEILAIYNSTRDYYVSNHILPRTDDYGNYNYTFNASTTGSYEIKVNTTYYGKYAEANDTLVVGAPPTASLGTNPVPYYYDSDGSIIFDLKCSDDVGVDTLQLWGNWSGWHANQTNSTPQNNTWWNVTVNGIPEGIWKWGAWCNDTSGQEDWSDVNRTFTVDTQPPIISGETREPDPTYHSDNATLNATISDPNLESVWISGNWSGSWVNYTGGITNVGDVYSHKLLSGNLSCYEVVGWRYYANDTSGNVGQGSLQDFTVQNHVPSNVSLEEPPNGTITADNTTFFDWSNATDDDGDSITYTLQVDNDTDFLSLEVEKTELTNSDYTLTDPEALEDDVYYWRVYSNDTCDTNLSDTWQFEVNPIQAVAVSLSDELAQGINWTISAVPIFNESADGNNGSGVTEYDVEVSAEGTNVDLYIKADDDLTTSGGDVLGLGNETHSYNQSNNTVPSDLKFQLTLQYSDNQIGDNLPNGTKVYLKFFLSAPASQPAGTYNNTVMVKAVPYGYSP